MSAEIIQLYTKTTPLSNVFQSLFKSSTIELVDYDIHLIKILLGGLNISSVSGATPAERVFLRFYKNYQKRSLKVCIFLLTFAYLKRIPYFSDGEEYLLDSYIDECDF